MNETEQLVTRVRGMMTASVEAIRQEDKEWCGFCQKKTLTDTEFQVSGVVDGEPTVDKEPICAECRRPR